MFFGLDAPGVTSAGLGGKKTIANKLAHLLAALSELEDATVEYRQEVVLAGDGGMVSAGLACMVSPPVQFELLCVCPDPALFP